MKNISLILALLFVGQFSFAQNKKVKEVKIKTSIQCGMCVDKLENMFADYWAVKSVDYKVEEQLVTVSYNSKKTSADEIRKKIAAEGYDADDVMAVKKAYDALPGCCKKGAHIPEVAKAEHACSEGEDCEKACCAKEKMEEHTCKKGEECGAECKHTEKPEEEKKDN